MFEKSNIVLKDMFGLKNRVDTSPVHLKLTVDWIKRAQNATPDDGVSSLYRLGKGWSASYPETTGYIVPSLLQYGHYFSDSDAIKRALDMTSWLQDTQHQQGYIQGGTIDEVASPAIFNTGQVLFGYCAAYRKTNDAGIKLSLKKAADYLVGQQDDDGHWRKNLSRFCSSNTDHYTYNIRTAWALYKAFIVTQNEKYRDAACQNMSAVMLNVKMNGWFPNNCLDNDNNPYLHTIAYTLQGLLELSLLAGENENIDVVIAACSNLAESYKNKNQFFGRYDCGWNPTVKWRCLTGEAQLSVVLYRLSIVTGTDKWKKLADSIVSDLKQTQVLSSRNKNIVGGIKGSQPVYGLYGKYAYLNWAAKFFIDALMLNLGHDEASMDG